MNKKIDLYYAGDYLCSTNQSKTCKAAVKAYLDRITIRGYYNDRLDARIIQHPSYLKARFDRTRKVS